jgi:hypothetical protein
MCSNTILSHYSQAGKPSSHIELKKQEFTSLKFLNDTGGTPVAINLGLYSCLEICLYINDLAGTIKLEHNRLRRVAAGVTLNGLNCNSGHEVLGVAISLRACHGRPARIREGLPPLSPAGSKQGYGKDPGSGSEGSHLKHGGAQQCN